MLKGCQTDVFERELGWEKGKLLASIENCSHELRELIRDLISLQ
jgi:hypothetical protein